MSPAPRAVPVKLEYTLGELKERSAARRQRILLEAAPQINALQKKLSKSSRLGLETVEASTAEEALKFYNAVVADGRYVSLMKRNPEAAAQKLGQRIAPEVGKVISRIVSRVGGDVEGPVEAVIAVAVVIVLAPKIPADGVVIDELARVTVNRL
jgi:hypothetical protein